MFQFWLGGVNKSIFMPDTISVTAMARMFLTMFAHSSRDPSQLRTRVRGFLYNLQLTNLSTLLKIFRMCDYGCIGYSA